MSILTMKQQEALAEELFKTVPVCNNPVPIYMKIKEWDSTQSPEKMTVRDCYATSAMNATISSKAEFNIDVDAVARFAFKMADAMLAARERKYEIKYRLYGYKHGYKDREYGLFDTPEEADAARLKLIGEDNMLKINSNFRIDGGLDYRIDKVEVIVYGETDDVELC